MAKELNTNGVVKWCFTYMGNILCVAPQPMNGKIGYPDECTLESFDTEEEATNRIIELNLDYSQTEWTP